MWHEVRSKDLCDVPVSSVTFGNFCLFLLRFCRLCVAIRLLKVCRLLLGRIAVLYVYATYCFRRSTVVCQSVCRSVTIVSHAKTAEPIEMPFGIWIRVGRSKEPCIRWGWGPVPAPRKGAILRGEWRSIMKYRDSVVSCAKTAVPRSRCSPGW